MRPLANPFLMKSIFISIIFWPYLGLSQFNYAWLAIDYQNLWSLGRDVIETDSFFVLTATTGTPWDPLYGQLIRVNKYTWETQFFTPGLFDCYTLKAVELKETALSTSIIACGYYYNGAIETDSVDIFLLELDPITFDTIRLKKFGLPGRCDNMSSMILTQDGGVAVTGWSFFSDPSPNQSIFLFKADSLWNQEYFNLYAQVPNRNHFGNSLVQTPDGGFFIVGSRGMDQDYFMSQALLLKVDAEGTLQFWEDIMPGTGEYGLIAVDVEKKEDGNYLAVGNKLLTINGVVVHYRQYWAFEFDEEGQIVWSDSYGGLPYGAQWVSVNPAPDGNYLVCGYYREDSHYENDTLFKRQYGAIGKLSPEGELLWHRLYTNEPLNKHVDIFWNAIPTSDGGILCVGTTWSDSTHQDVWAVKLDEWGCIEPGCEGPVGLVEVEVGEDLFTVYPNPAHSQIQLSAALPVDYLGPAVLSAHNLLGQLIWSETLEPGSVEIQKTLDVSGWLPGVYVFSLEAGGRVWVEKIAKY